MTPLLLAAALAGAPPADTACEAWRESIALASTEVSEPECAKLLAEACDGGRRLACADLGRLLEVGESLPRDPERARGYLQRACTAGVGRACADLALALLRRGEEAPARAALEEGCAVGSGLACALRVPDERDPARARRLAERACDLGDAGGCLALAARTPGGPARRTLERACRLGAADACDALARRALEARCDGGDAGACVRLASLLEAGRVLVADGARAAALYGRACSGGRQDACVRLGTLHRAGVGVPQDEARARTLYADACRAGEADGCRLLEEPAPATPP